MKILITEPNFSTIQDDYPRSTPQQPSVLTPHLRNDSNIIVSSERSYMLDKNAS